MKKILSFLFVCCATGLFAQPSFEWAYLQGNTANEEGAINTIDSQGNIFLASHFSNTIDLDPSAGTQNYMSSTGFDAYIQKVDDQSILQWNYILEGTGNLRIWDITTDINDDVIVTGRFDGSVDLDGIPNANSIACQGQYNLFVLKVSSSGNFIWSYVVENTTGTGYVEGSLVESDSNGEILIYGTFGNIAKFNPGVPSSQIDATPTGGGGDSFFLKIDGAGNFLWVKNVGEAHNTTGPNSLKVLDLKRDHSDNFVMTGYMNGTVDFDLDGSSISRTSNGSRDIFAWKIDNSGNSIFAASAGAISEDYGNSITVDSNNDIYVGGYFQWTVDFDPDPVGTSNLISEGNEDAFLWKLSNSGNFVWVKQFGGADFEYVEKIDVDIVDRIYLTGRYSGTVDFDPDPVSQFNMTNSFFDLFLCTIDSTGNFVFAQSIQGPGNEYPLGVNVHSNGDLYISGRILSSADFDPGSGNTTLMTNGLGDAFLVKLSQCEFELDFDLTTLPDLTDECSVSTPAAPTASNFNGSYNGVPDVSFPITTQGTTVITWTYTNGIGRTFTQTQEIIIDDVSAPVADIASLTDITDECEVTSLTAPTATDNCAGSITGTHNASLPITSTITITWTYDDGNGNTSTQTQEVIIDDVSAPVADIASLTDITDECEVTSLTAPTATDNCAGAITGTHGVTLPITSTTTIIWTYDDGNGNTSTQTQEVIIDDVTAPVPDIASLTDITDECEVTSLTAPTATDNCVGIITGTHNASLPITTQGTTTITWTYDDGNGNTSTQTQDVVISDATAPAADLANLADINSECEVTPTAPTATDNCAGAITGTPDVAFPIIAIGTTTVTWTYDDGNGNTSTQTQDVVITPIDNTVSVVNDITLSADASGYTYQWVDCNDNNAPIAGETNQTFEATANGSYAVIIDNGNCSVTSACNDITTVGLDQNQIETISVFPNPTSGILTIRSSGVFDKIEIMNTLGQVVSSIELNQLDEYQIQLPDSKGVYMVKVSDQANYKIVRVIKK